MATYNLTEHLTEVADAIREADGTQEPINPQDFAAKIRKISSGGFEFEIGDYLETENPTSPADRFGGSWEELPQGTFTMSAGEGGQAGQTGGSNTHIHSLGAQDDTEAFAIIDLNIANADGGSQRGILSRLSTVEGYSSNLFMFIDGGAATFRDQSYVLGRLVQVVGSTKPADNRPQYRTTHKWRKVA